MIAITNVESQETRLEPAILLGGSDIRAKDLSRNERNDLENPARNRRN